MMGSLRRSGRVWLVLAGLAALAGCEPAAGPARVLLDRDILISDLSSPQRISHCGDTN